MYFLELVLQNYRPFKGRHVINFDPGERKRPIVLFGGMNGAGKTSINEAISLALYGHRAQLSSKGKTPYAEFLESCTNRHCKGSEQTRIELEFATILESDLHKIRIIRTWDRSVQGKDSLTVLRDGWVDESLASTWDETIEQLFPLGISSLFLFDGEQIRELADLESPSTQMIKSIRELFGLGIADRLGEDLTTLVRRSKSALEADPEWKDLASKVEAAKVEINAKRSQQKELSLLLQNAEAAVESCQGHFNYTNDQFLTEGGRLTEEQSKLQAAVTAASDRIKQIKQSMVSLAGGFLPFCMVRSLAERALTQAQLELAQEKNSVIAQFMETWDDEFIQFIDKLKLQSAKVQQIQQYLDENLSRLQQPAADRWMKAEASDTAALAHVYSSELPAKSLEASELLEALSQADVQLHAIEMQLSKAASPERYEQLKRSLQLAQEQLISAQVHRDGLKNDIERLERDIDKIQSTLEKRADEYFALKGKENIIDSTPKVQETLAIYKERILTKKLTALESQIAEFFGYLLHKNDLVHRVSIDHKNFRMKIYDPSGHPIPKKQLSAGEQQMLAISFLWALSKVSKYRIPVVIDTPLGRLDSAHREALITRYFPEASHQVVLFSTDTEIDDRAIKQLRQTGAIAREYLLAHEPVTSRAYAGYFW
jgi:DNA sulfur modification protein DndD